MNEYLHCGVARPLWCRPTFHDLRLLCSVSVLLGRGRWRFSIYIHDGLDLLRHPEMCTVGHCTRTRGAPRPLLLLVRGVAKRAFQELLVVLLGVVVEHDHQRRPQSEAQ